MSITQAIIGTNLTISAGGGGGGPVADFTIEWWQKVENSSTNARPWSVGLYPVQKLSLSYESLTSDYFWINDSFIMITPQNHVGAGWRHMAYVRSGGVVRGYINGTQYTSDAANTNLITATNVPLYVGTGELAAGNYKGFITNLHIMKGFAKYTGNFTPATSPLVSTTGSVFLMRTSSDGTKYTDSAGGKVAIGVTGFPTWSSDSPFTALGPYTQSTNQSGSAPGGVYVISFTGDNYNTDLLNVKAGWTVTDGVLSGTVVGDAVIGSPGYIDIPVDFNPIGTHTWTFTQPGLGSVYFNGGAYLNYGASADWAMDVII